MRHRRVSLCLSRLFHKQQTKGTRPHDRVATCLRGRGQFHRFVMTRHIWISRLFHNKRKERDRLATCLRGRGPFRRFVAMTRHTYDTGLFLWPRSHQTNVASSSRHLSGLVEVRFTMTRYIRSWCLYNKRVTVVTPLSARRGARRCGRRRTARGRSVALRAPDRRGALCDAGTTVSLFRPDKKETKRNGGIMNCRGALRDAGLSLTARKETEETKERK